MTDSQSTGGVAAPERSGELEAPTNKGSGNAEPETSGAVSEAKDNRPADPPNFFGTTIGPFKQLPYWLQEIIRRQWAALSPEDQAKVQRNLKTWDRSGRPTVGQGYEGGEEIVGETPVAITEQASVEPKKRKTYGDFAPRLTKL